MTSEVCFVVRLLAIIGTLPARISMPGLRIMSSILHNRCWDPRLR